MGNLNVTRGRLAVIISIVLASAAGGALLAPQEARADDCILDTNNDGGTGFTPDTDGGADSGGDDLRLACGTSATATGSNSTAVGASSAATGASAIAVG